MNVYCLLKDGNEIRRISLSQELQKQLSEYLKNSVDSLVNLEEIEFSGEYKPEEGEILIINDFDNPYKNFNPSTTENLKEEEIESIKTLVFKIDDNKIAYQCFDNRKIIKPEKWFLIYSQNTYSKIDNKGLIIDSKIDAVFYEGKLLFNSYHNASRIFDLSKYYREATDKEIDNFISNNIIKGGDGFDKSLLNSRMRKKLFLIEKNEVLKKVNENFEVTATYSEKFDISSCFDITNKKILIPNKKQELEKLLNFLNDDLYNSPITGVNYETNSKRSISAKNKTTYNY